MASREADRDGYTLAHAVQDVFGPDLTWLSWLVVAGGGALGAACAPLVPDAAARPWAGAFTCAALGVVAGGLLTLVPRLVGLVALGSGLRSRPATDDVSRPWWPLRLVAAALADTPPLRRTASDFEAAIAAVQGRARGLVGRRLWPACAAAFAAPALGLVAAWLAWGAYVNSGELRVGRMPTVGEKAVLPMAVSIIAALVLMLAVVGVDQWIRRLLDRWAGAVRDTDAAAGFVAAQLGDGMAIRVPDTDGGPSSPGGGGVTVPPAPVSRPVQPPQRISADAIEGLGNVFKNS